MYGRCPRDILSFTLKWRVATNRLHETACWRRLSKFGCGLLGRKQDRAVGVGSLEGWQAMNFVRHTFLIATAVLVLTFWTASPSLAQSSAADELIKRVEELYQAGKYAEAIPPACPLSEVLLPHGACYRRGS